jgi:hypothetical protein
MDVVNDAYQAFRAKWDTTLPQQYPGGATLDLVKLRQTGPVNGKDFEPELEMEMDEVEVI